MRRILVCTGVLGGGTALAFALAAATSMLFPQGTLVPAGWNGNARFEKGMPVMVEDVMPVVTVEAPAIAVPVPEPVP